MLTFKEWRRETSGTRADYDNYVQELIAPHQAAVLRDLPPGFLRDLVFLHRNGKLGGVAKITAVRASRLRAWLDRGYPPGGLVTAASAKIAGPHPDPQAYATGAALLAAEIDRLETGETPPW